MVEKRYEVRDPIYGFITFNEWEKEIIGQSCFQRLRRIRQLSLTDMVYPGATHTRFEHSLGVMHLATLMYEHIIGDKKNRAILEDELGYNDAGIEKDKQLIRLAALLHDVGHAPFSHTSEGIMPINKKKNKPHKHEDYTSAIIKGPLKETIENHQINKTNFNIKAEEVAALIEGDGDILGDKLFWQVLISSQLDADRGDYLLRDSYHIGVKYGIFDHCRLLNTLALGIYPESDKVVLGVAEDGWHVAESIVIARYQMFTQVYFHKTRRAYDYHLKEASKVVLDNGQLPPPEEIFDFLKIDDYNMWCLFKKNQDNYHCRSILDRKHVRVVYKTPETPDETDENNKERNKRILDGEGIPYYEDKAGSLWYKIKGSEEGTTEISIMCDKGRERKVKPLEELSSIVSNMGEIKKIRIYVKPEDRKRAKEVLESQKIVCLKNQP